MGAGKSASGREGKIAVLIADDQANVRNSIRRLLRCEADMVVVGEAENGRVAIQLAEEFHPDVILMDIAMPVLNGVEATRQILKLLPSTRVLVLSSSSEDWHIEESFAAGVAGYMIKQTDVPEIVQAIREVQGGRVWCNPVVAERYRELRKGRGSSGGTK